mmetsp:Transcript_24739/g.69253  ORF Transcript_24739/g.69253 Transcript_24739/m.69253 type:complete len:247 (-) Transcript_24739:380-1120(-)
MSNVCFRRPWARAERTSVSWLLPPYAVEHIKMSAPPPVARVTHREQMAASPTENTAGREPGLTGVPESSWRCWRNSKTPSSVARSFSSAVSGRPARRCSIPSAMGVVTGVAVRFRTTRMFAGAIRSGFLMWSTCGATTPCTTSLFPVSYADWTASTTSSAPCAVAPGTAAWHCRVAPNLARTCSSASLNGRPSSPRYRCTAPFAVNSTEITGIERDANVNTCDTEQPRSSARKSSSVVEILEETRR